MVRSPWWANHKPESDPCSCVFVLDTLYFLLPSNHHHLDSLLLQFIDIVSGKPLVGDDRVNVFQAADFPKAFFSKFARVHQNNRALDRSYHLVVKMGFHHVGSCKPIIQADPIDTQKKLTAGKILNHFLRIMSYYRTAAFSDSPSKLDDLDIG